MVLDLRASALPTALNSSYATPEENNAMAAQVQQDQLAGMSTLGRAIGRGLYQTPAGIADAAGQVLEPFAPSFSQPVFDWASAQRDVAKQMYLPTDIRETGQIHGAGDALNYITNMAGENIPNAIPTMIGGIGARIGMRGMTALSPFAKTAIGGSIAAFPQQMGEGVGALREDPAILANTTPGQRLAASAAYGAATAPLEALPDTLLTNRLAGGGEKVLKNVFKDGLGKTAKDAAKHVAMAVPESALTEGVPEALEQKGQQLMQSHFNPNRDTSKDEHDLKESFFGGWAAGGGTSAVGRTADVGWAQGRGATEAIRDLLTPKRLPDNLKDSDDQSVINWDNQDNEQRNEKAAGIAQRILDSDAGQKLKGAATDFFEKMKDGSSDAWTSLSDAVGEHDYVQRSKAGLDHFLNSVKKANAAAFGKADSEATGVDQDLYDNFTSHLDPRGSAARDTEQKSNLFNTVKQSLQDDSWHELPWHALEDQFGTIGRATAAVTKLRENMVRAGQLEHDDEFSKLLEATANDGQKGERAMMDVVSRYGKDYINRQPQDSELREVVRGIRNFMANPENMKKHGEAFNAEMQKSFGKNTDKVLAALAPKNKPDTEVDTSEESGATEFAPGSRFVGSGTKSARKAVASNDVGDSIAAHGGFWKLGAADEKVRAEIKKRFNDTAADLRKDGHYVRALTPLEYAAEAGVSPGKIAKHLGTSIEGLKDHPARMLAVDDRDREKDKVSLDKDDLLNLADKAKAAFAGLDKGMPVTDKEQRTKIAAALGKKGGAQRKAMKELGLEHGVKLRLGKNGAYLENNPRHSGNGVFNVHMADGTVHHVSAQHLIATMRERGKGQFSSRSAYDMFNSGVAALMNIDGVQKITANDIWGRTDERPFALAPNAPNYFQLEPGLNLGEAHKASKRGKGKASRIEELEAEFETADEDRQEEIKDEIAAELAKQAEYEGEGERQAVAGEIAPTNDNVTPTEHQREGVKDFNDDGTPKHPYGKPIEHGAPNVSHTFNGMVLSVRPGVSNKHFTEGARKVISVVKQLRKIKDSPTFTSKRLDMAADLLARSAAAAKNGDTKARDAAVAAAADAVLESVVDEMLVAKEQGDNAAVAKLRNLGAAIKHLQADYKLNKAKYDELLGKYAPPKTAKVEAPKTEAKTEASKNEEKVEEAPKAEHDAVAEEEQTRLDSTTARAQRNAEQARAKSAEQHEQALEAALTDVEKLQKNIAGVAKNLRAAFANLKDAYVNGELNNKDLVANLRAAAASFRAAAGDAARIVTQAVQRFIKEYNEVKVAASKPSVSETTVEEQHNSEGSFAAGAGVTEAQFKEAKGYIEKVLGPNIKVQLVKDLGGNSAAWNRVDGETIIRIALHATNPVSKAHHEAMHEFFQRLLDSESPAADVLRKAANSPAVRRQIEQFFHNDANYAKIKEALNDEHERVAYMFQLWNAGKLNLGPQTKTWFQKIADFFRKAAGMLTDSQKAEAIMQHFHNGEMSTMNDVARVLSNDPKAVQDFMGKAAEWAKPVARAAKELLYTAQNTLIDSGNKSFEQIGRKFSTETGRAGEEISFMDAKTMKTNQFNDRLWNTLRHNDPKDTQAALDMLQRGDGALSNDPKIALIQKQISAQLKNLLAYMKDAGVKIKEVDNYFPRVWDTIKIAENKDKFKSMLMADHLKSTGKPMSDALADSVVETITQNRGAEPVNEDELASGYSPFMAAHNKRVLGFITNPAFADFQEKSIESIMTNYIAQAVHKAEYTRRFGENGTKLRSMVLDGVGEKVGPEWQTAREAAQKRLDDLKERNKKDLNALHEALDAQGYRYGEIQIQHVVNELTGDAAKRFADFQPELNRATRAIKAMEGTLGADIKASLRKINAGVMVYENMRLLALSLFSQVIDPLGVIVRGGTVGQAWDTFKLGAAGTIAAWRGTPLEGHVIDLATKLGIVDAGAYLNSQGNAYTSVFLGKTAQKWNDRLFRMNGVEGFSQGTRMGAMLAAIEFIKAHKSLPTEHSERWLAELNLKPADIKLIAGDLDYNDVKIQQAIFRWVEGAILRPNASMRPSWASDPHFALIFHMKQFTYAMQKVLLERITNEAKHGNYDPAISAMLTYVPAMLVADFLRGLAANGGDEPAWKKKWKAGDYLSDAVQRAGLLGIPQLALDVNKWGVGELAGPAGEQVIRAGKTFAKDIEKDAYYDDLAKITGKAKDIERAKEFNGIEHAAKRTLRDALPVSSLAKKYVFDEVVGK